MKEYEILKKYEYPVKPIEAPFDVVSQAIYNKSMSLINIELCKNEIAEVFDYYKIKLKYDFLAEKADEKLYYTNNEFVFEDFKFQTLDEVEKAIKNKAFL